VAGIVEEVGEKHHFNKESFRGASFPLIGKGRANPALGYFMLENCFGKLIKSKTLIRI
jgi:hypothetical protein